MPGVVAVFTKEDLADLIKAPLPMAWDPPGVEIKVPENWPLSGSQVKHVGDAIAVVLAETKGQAMDAADLVIADLDPLPAVVDPEKALEDGSPLVWEEFGTNATHHWAVAGGDFAAAEAEAEVVVKQRVPNHRISGAPIEPRGCVGESRGESVALYSATQIPHIARFLLAGILEMPEDKIRVVAPDVGGGFGAKLQLYGEEVLVLALAKKLNRPVKYVETRSEHMSNSHHGRDQIATVTLTAKKDGTVTGCKAEVIADTGAYHQLLTPFIASLGFPVAGGCYKFPSIDFSVTGVFTNKMPIDAIRGAGRPEATYWIEQTMDKLARELDMDPLELRRKNFIRQGGVPVRDAAGHRLRLRRLPRARWTSCWRTSTWTRSARSRPSCASRASTAASASRPGSRCAAWRRHAPSARRASASRPRSGSRPWCACTRPARPPSTRARRRTARAWTRRSRRSRPTGWASTPR